MSNKLIKAFFLGIVFLLASPEAKPSDVTPPENRDQLRIEIARIQTRALRSEWDHGSGGDYFVRPYFCVENEKARRDGKMDNHCIELSDSDRHTVGTNRVLTFKTGSSGSRVLDLDMAEMVRLKFEALEDLKREKRYSERGIQIRKINVYFSFVLLDATSVWSDLAAVAVLGLTGEHPPFGVDHEYSMGVAGLTVDFKELLNPRSNRTRILSSHTTDDSSRALFELRATVY